MTADYDDLIARLAAVAEAIDERTLAALHEAVAGGATRRPDSDRHLVQARRAVEKAMVALRRASGSGSTGDTDSPFGE